MWWWCKLKWEHWRAERRWLKSKLTVHKQIYESIKQEAIDSVDNAKTVFFSSKIQASKTCKELFQNFNTILGKNNSTPVSSSLNSDDLPQAFSKFFTDKNCTIRNSFPSTNPTVSVDQTSYCGKHSYQSLNDLFWNFFKRLLPNHVILIPFPQNYCMKTLTFFFPQSPTSSTLPWNLVSCHLTWKLWSSNPC